ncbi:hypothetical protein A4S05_23500 [Nostoc sp. KVJ20]|uniref:hypothetical protein n=1 Tax=Nostoc sp. KVJ20 TaxID=457944 RepID=UPI00083DEF1B|nr:hypothetical protein [Nostoc sp. KVJ20]ODH02579.1 hypothetical protein A4S05_23500 [Nostoc sp. KVJ20]
MAKWDEVGEELAKKLHSVKKESTIQKLAVAVIDHIRESYTEPNSRRTPLAKVRKAILAAFPDTETQEHPWQYFTNKGKGNIERYQHLALKYLTLSTEEWDAIGDEARQQWKAQQQAQQIEQKPEQQPETPQVAQTILDDMNISQLQLDGETQEMVEKAIAHSGISLADFVRKACQVYAKTVTGKQGQYESDLTAVPTEELLSSAAYKTHPGRAEELARRAIYALETHNNNCTEKSQKWMITQTAIQSLTGSKPATIKAILERYQTRLDDHNTKHELNPYDNRKPGRKIDDEIDLATLVPDGTSLA